MKNTKPLIKLTGITKDYKSGDVITKALKGISLEIKHGDFIAITGRSGSGKSTLMNILGLLDTPTAGAYILEGINVSKFNEDELSDLRNKKIGFIFQSFNLLPRLTALENVVLPSIYAGMETKEREKKAREMLARFGLENRLNNRPNQLSGGQQQKVAIARSLMNNPEIILADEPTGNLDIKSGQELLNIIKQLNRGGKTIIMITHEQDIARQAKKIIKLADGMLEK